LSPAQNEASRKLVPDATSRLVLEHTASPKITSIRYDTIGYDKFNLTIRFDSRQTFDSNRFVWFD